MWFKADIFMKSFLYCKICCIWLCYYHGIRKDKRTSNKKNSELQQHAVWFLTWIYVFLSFLSCPNNSVRYEKQWVCCGLQRQTVNASPPDISWELSTADWVPVWGLALECELITWLCSLRKRWLVLQLVQGLRYTHSPLRPLEPVAWDFPSLKIPLSFTGEALNCKMRWQNNWRSGSKWRGRHKHVFPSV